MCHRRGDRSRTASRAGEPDERAEKEREPWAARARARLSELVAIEAEDAGRESGRTGGPDETPERPTAEPTTAEAENAEAEDAEGTDNAEETGDEREEEPVPADD